MACGSSTAKSHDLCTVVFLYTLIYDRIQEKYDDLRPYMGKIRSLTVSVFRHIRSRTYTIVIRSHVIRQNTVVYGDKRNVYGCLRPYTDSVNLDLGWLEPIYLSKQLGCDVVLYTVTCRFIALCSMFTDGI